MAYDKGDIVHLRVDPSRQGSIVDILPAVGGVRKYLVFHSASYGTREYFENQLNPVTKIHATSDLTNAILQGDYLSSDEFRARISAARLSNPQSDSLYSLHAARIQYVPFQFKPLLRFLRAEKPRLLIADEVGVGKTIEAGLILRELQSRQEIENVLIVCPKALVLKWQAEMLRFDEKFDLLTPEILQYCIKETNLDGTWPAKYARGIVSLELLRNKHYLEGKRSPRKKHGLLTLETPPRFSMVIFDEAHHLRNPETKGHQAARFLCDVSDAVLFLSATPVHLGSQNLYSLLNLLRQDLFPDFAVFQQMIEPNVHLIRSMRHIRTRIPEHSWQGAGLSAIDDAMHTTWGDKVLREDPRIVEWRNRLSQQAELTDEERIRFLRDLEEVHTLAHLMNRTRRRDIGQFTIRDPHPVEVGFTPVQKEFYGALIDFRRKTLSLKYDPRIVRLVSDTLERQASSCLPALLPMLDKFLTTGRFTSARFTDDLESDEDTKMSAPLVKLAEELRKKANDLPPHDPKLERLTEIIRDVLNKSGPKKVLVFSFFLHTLDYLENKLSAAGFRVQKIIGNMDEVEERAPLRQRFRLPGDDRKAIDILLSSEVGCEGLDYEFCDCLVNYDIPWNPMRIEQRIGRIDRFGQKSEKVFIYNFITPGTVEERIFYRCFERLGIFRNTVGDLEEVLGELGGKLSQIAYNPDLSLEQTEERALQMSDNVLRQAEEQRRLEKESETLLGLDQSFIEEVDTLVEEGRFVSPNDLEQMIKLYVEQDEIRGGITPVPRKPGHRRLRLNEEARAVVLKHVNALESYGRTNDNFRKWLRGKKPYFLLTYDRETALEQRDLPFITPVHPLAKAAVNYWQHISKPLVANLTVKDSQLRAGVYFFALELWETVGLQPEIRLKTFAWDLRRQKMSEEINSLMLLLERASGLQDLQGEQDPNISRSIDSVNEYANEIRLEEVERLKRRNSRISEQRLANLESYYLNRLAQIKTELEQNTNERIRIMKQSEMSRITSDFDHGKREIEERRDCDIIVDRIAQGILTIHSD